ncbi:nudix hydrolase 2 [Impatiens glandulifera]|uniref:nudix hydrolase 2 n=1 Tax=Impatiens glandulifera TaxID=253017 RepID=UPI001FB14505|nr:nudix hydrolase 2 [Impatiens glandulifera]
MMLAPAAISSSSSSSSEGVALAPDAQVKGITSLLTCTNDDHGGILVEMTKDPMDAAFFTTLLRASVSHWRHQGKRGVWIKMPIQLANLVEPAVKEGFYFHHAEPQYLMLVYWIPETACTLPINATHRVGIGAFVMNKNGEVLVVQEKSGTFRGTGVWKFPTGVADQGEDICAAAVREVKEETGIETRFVEILAFRQSHKSFFDKSDLFFVCLMHPLSFEIQVQETEIEAAQWMPYEEYAAQPFVQTHELFRYIVDICAAKREGKYSGFSPVPTATSFSRKSCYLYMNKQNLTNQ